MKKSSILVMMIAFVMGSVACACGDVAIDTENFPDEDFRVFVSRYDIGDRGYKGYKDGIFSNEELQKVTEILCDHLNIVDLKGIEFFTALKHLDCSGNQITTLDVSENATLTYLDCSGNQITTLNVSKNADLTILRCSSNLLTSLDLRGCVTLEHLDCSQNYLSTLDLSKNVALTLIYCEDNELTVLNLEEYTELTRLNCTNNRLHSLNVEGCIDLTYLSCYHNQLTTLNVNGCNNLQHIDCQYNQLVTLNVDECNALYWLVCHDNRLQRLDMSNCTAIAELWCNDNQLVTLDVSNNPSLTTLHCENNLLTLLNLNNCQNLRNIYCDNEVKIIRSTTDKPTITTDILPTATKDQLYSLQLTATGSYPITWSLKSGKLPPNIILSESGLISGTPTKVAKYTFTVKASNSEGEDLKELTLAVSASSPITITTTSLKVGTINKSYNVTLKANGTKPLTWSAEGLPSGLTCSEKGKISGKPTAFGTFNVNFTVSNGAGSTIRELQLTIKGIPPKLSGSLAKGELSVPYSSGLKLTKGSTPITWSIEGSLPQGLTFDTEKGIISGTPMSYKSSRFKLKITASNGAGKASKSVNLKVKGTKPKITTTLPSATQGRSYSAKLTATGSEPITWNATNLPEGLSINGDTIFGTPTGAAKSYKVKLTAKNPVKSVKKTVTLKVIEASDTSLPAMSEAVGNSYSFAEYSVLPELTLANSDGYVVVAVLPETSVDVSGMYDFNVALSNDVPEGAELVYLANSDKPSDDDDIAEFFDAEGEPVTSVPESRLITISVWLNTNTVYKPAIAIKQ